MNKKNYNEVFKQFIENLDDNESKPTLFLHACCGPCSTYPLIELIEYFNITIGYINPNIFPESEYELRYAELKRFVDEVNETYKKNIKIIKYDYNYSLFLDRVKGHEMDKEGGERCTICHKLRLEESYKYASKNNYDYFTSVMTVSSKKPSNLLNEICLKLQDQYPNTKYIPTDFKKENGTLKGIKICKEHNLYRQNYCGCSFSKREREEYLKRKKIKI